MKLHRKILPTVLCIVLLLSAVFSSCQANSESAYVTYVYERIPIEIAYQKTEQTEWRPDRAQQLTNIPVSGNVEKVPWSPDLDPPAEPNTTVTVETPRYYSYTHVHPSVYDFLESGSVEKRQFFIRPNRYDFDDCANWSERDLAFQKLMKRWARKGLPMGEVLEKIGFIAWEGTAAELLAIADEDHQIWVCFPENFEEIFGMTVEQARNLIDEGQVNRWCCPVQDSVLYGRSPSDIQAIIEAGQWGNWNYP